MKKAIVILGKRETVIFSDWRNAAPLPGRELDMFTAEKCFTLRASDGKERPMPGAINAFAPEVETALSRGDERPVNVFWPVTSGALGISGATLAAYSPSISFLLVRELTERERERFTKPAPAPTATPTQPAKGKRPRYPVTLEEAARIVGRTARSVHGWEAGKGTPDGYPGRGDAVALNAWASRRTEQDNLKKSLARPVRVADVGSVSQWRLIAGLAQNRRLRGADWSRQVVARQTRRTGGKRAVREIDSLNAQADVDISGRSEGVKI